MLLNYRYNIFTFILSSLMVLTACSQELETPFEANYVARVEVAAGDTIASIEATYGGRVSLWRPENGFALLGFQEESNLGQLSGIAESNQDTFFAPFRAAGSVAWKSGSAVWGGGSAAWGGGSAAWGGGATALGGGQGYTGSLPPQQQNALIWTKLRLPESYDIAQTWGAGITVAVLDTGVDTAHPALQNQLSPQNTWYDFVDGDTNPQEGSSTGHGYGHGTAVAGLVVQVAPSVKIMPLRVLDAQGRGDTDDIFLAIYHAIDKGADIINLSLGSKADSVLLIDAINFAYSRGVAVIASVGNEGEVRHLFPAKFSPSFPNLLAVGSLSRTEHLSLFSNFDEQALSTKKHVYTYGEGLYTIYPNASSVYATGTSFAAPLVSGTVALGLARLRQSNPTATATPVIAEFNDELASSYFFYSLSDLRRSVGVSGLNGRLVIRMIISEL